MSVTIPQPFKTKVLGPITLSGIPSAFSIKIEERDFSIKIEDPLPTIKLDVGLDIEHIDKIRIAVDPVEIRLTELPSIRAHVPADFHLGLSVLGMELICVRLCGEAQIITEPYRPNPCEVCGPVRTTAALEPATPNVAVPSTRGKAEG